MRGVQKVCDAARHAGLCLARHITAWICAPRMVCESPTLFMLSRVFSLKSRAARRERAWWLLAVSRAQLKGKVGYMIRWMSSIDDSLLSHVRWQFPVACLKNVCCGSSRYLHVVLLTDVYEPSRARTFSLVRLEVDGEGVTQCIVGFMWCQL